MGGPAEPSRKAEGNARPGLIRRILPVRTTAMREAAGCGSAATPSCGIGGRSPPARAPALASGPAAARVGLSRQALFGGLVLAGFANGISEKVYYAVAARGWLAAAFDTFDVSVVIWGACLASLLLLRRSRDRQPVRSTDLAVAGLAVVLFLVPLPLLSWLALSLVALHAYRSAGDDGPLRRAAAIAFALTIPLLWARLFFATFSDVILALDATLVAWIVGTVPSGNVVPFADASGFLFLNPGCSSITNVSLAILCACVFVNLHDRRWSADAMLWTCAACAAVVFVNVLRISLIGLFPGHYQLIHGPVGGTVAAWLTVGAILGICLHGIGDAPRDS